VNAYALLCMLAFTNSLAFLFWCNIYRSRTRSRISSSKLISLGGNSVAGWIELTQIFVFHVFQAAALLASTGQPSAVSTALLGSIVCSLTMRIVKPASRRKASILHTAFEDQLSSAPITDPHIDLLDSYTAAQFQVSRASNVPLHCFVKSTTL